MVPFMKVEVKGKQLVITIDIEKRPSKSGKTQVVASSGGNIQTNVMYEDKPLVVGVNAYIK
jgi:hypothetical protein